MWTSDSWHYKPHLRQNGTVLNKNEFFDNSRFLMIILRWKFNSCKILNMNILICLMIRQHRVTMIIQSSLDIMWISTLACNITHVYVVILQGRFEIHKTSTKFCMIIVTAGFLIIKKITKFMINILQTRSILTTSIDRESR